MTHFKWNPHPHAFWIFFSFSETSAMRADEGKRKSSSMFRRMRNGVLFREIRHLTLKWIDLICSTKFVIYLPEMTSYTNFNWQRSWPDCNSIQHLSWLRWVNYNPCAEFFITSESEKVNETNSFLNCKPRFVRKQWKRKETLRGKRTQPMCRDEGYSGVIDDYATDKVNETILKLISFP